MLDLIIAAILLYRNFKVNKMSIIGGQWAACWQNRPHLH